MSVSEPPWLLLSALSRKNRPSPLEIRHSEMAKLISNARDRDGPPGRAFPRFKLKW